MKPDQFYLTLPSNSSMKYYPNNTVANYITQLPHEIQLSGEWEVAVVEVHYPCSFVSIRENSYVMLKVEKEEADAERSEVATDNPNMKKVIQKRKTYLRPKVYGNIEELITAINDDTELKKDIEMRYDAKTDRVSTNIVNANVKTISYSKRLAKHLGYESVESHVANRAPSKSEIKITNNDFVEVGEEKEDVTKTLSRSGIKITIDDFVDVKQENKEEVEKEMKIKYIRLKSGNYDDVKDVINAINNDPVAMRNIEFAYDDNAKKVNIKLKHDGVKAFAMNENLALQLGFDVTKQGKLNATRPANLRLGLPSQIYVYCDLVEPQFVGDTKAPLLQITNIDTNDYVYGTNQIVQYNTLHYLSLLRYNFDHIEIDLRDSTGQPIPFHFGTSCVKLHFRRA